MEPCTENGIIRPLLSKQRRAGSRLRATKSVVAPEIPASHAPYPKQRWCPRIISAVTANKYQGTTTLSVSSGTTPHTTLPSPLRFQYVLPSSQGLATTWSAAGRMRMEGKGGERNIGGEKEKERDKPAGEKQERSKTGGAGANLDYLASTL